MTITASDDDRSQLLPSVREPPSTEHDSLLVDLLVRTGRGDAASFEQLYGLTHQRVFGFALRVVLNRASAEDVTQATFLDAWRRSAQFDPGRSPVAAWLLMITHARAVDHVRKAQRARVYDQVSLGSAAARVPFDSVAETVAQRSEEAAVRTAVLQLSPVQRQAVEFVYWQDMTGAEASHALQVPLGTFKSRVKDALASLQVALHQSS